MKPEPAFPSRSSPDGSGTHPNHGVAVHEQRVGRKAREHIHAGRPRRVLPASARSRRATPPSCPGCASAGASGASAARSPSASAPVPRSPRPGMATLRPTVREQLANGSRVDHGARQTVFAESRLPSPAPRSPVHRGRPPCSASRTDQSGEFDRSREPGRTGTDEQHIHRHGFLVRLLAQQKPLAGKRRLGARRNEPSLCIHYRIHGVFLVGDPVPESDLPKTHPMVSRLAVPLRGRSKCSANRLVSTMIWPRPGEQHGWQGAPDTPRLRRATRVLARLPRLPARGNLGRHRHARGDRPRAGDRQLRPRRCLPRDLGTTYAGLVVRRLVAEAVARALDQRRPDGDLLLPGRARDQAGTPVRRTRLIPPRGPSGGGGDRRCDHAGVDLLRVQSRRTVHRRLGGSDGDRHRICGDDTRTARKSGSPVAEIVHYRAGDRG